MHLANPLFQKSGLLLFLALAACQSTPGPTPLPPASALAPPATPTRPVVELTFTPVSTTPVAQGLTPAPGMLNADLKWTSISPSGKWMAIYKEIPHHNQILSIASADGSGEWVAVDYEVGDDYLLFGTQPLHWSADENYFYFDRITGAGDCPHYPADLYQIDLGQRHTTQLVSQATHAKFFADQTLVYTTSTYNPPTEITELVVRSLASGQEQRITLALNGWVESIYGSPFQLVVVLGHSLCNFDTPHLPSLSIILVDRGLQSGTRQTILVEHHAFMNVSHEYKAYVEAIQENGNTLTLSSTATGSQWLDLTTESLVTQTQSPYGNWQATLSVKSPSLPSESQTRLNVVVTDRVHEWIGLDSSMQCDLRCNALQPIHWSPDGRYFFFAVQPSPEACFTTDATLYRIDLTNGQVAAVVSGNNFSFSPDATKIAFTLHATELSQLGWWDLATQQEGRIDLATDWPTGLVWSPDSTAVMLTLISDPCDYYGPSVVQVNVDTRTSTIFSASAYPDHDIGLWHGIGWAAPDKISVLSIRHSTWELNRVTGDIMEK